MIDRLAMIEVAMTAASDSEWGYDSDAAAGHLEEMDPDYDWDMPLFEAELKTGHRTMGPRTPPSEHELLLLRMYEPVVRDALRNDPWLLGVLSRD